MNHLVTIVSKVLLTLILAACSNSVFLDGFYFPQIIYEHSIPLHQNLTLIKSDSNNNLIQTLNSDHQLVTIDAIGYNPNSSNIFSELNSYQNSTITDFYSEMFYRYSFLINDQGKVVFMDMAYQNIVFSFQTNVTGTNKIFTTNQTIYILNYFQGNQTEAVLYRFSRQYFNLLQIIKTNITGTVQMRVCKLYQLQIEQTVVLWNQTSFFTIFYCTDNCSNIFQIPNNYPGDITNDILFSSCFSIIVEYDNQMPVTNYIFSNGNSHSIAQINQKILGMKYWDQSGQYIALFLQNNVLQIYSIWGSKQYPNNLVIQYNAFSSLTVFSLVDRPKSKIYVPFSNRIESYLIKCPSLTYMSAPGLCLSCQTSNCSSCDPKNGTCIACENQFVLNLGLCHQVNSSDLLYQVNSTDNYTYNNAQKTYVITFIENGFMGICLVVKNLFFIFQATPVSYLFLRFINYWNISSLYLLAKIKIPSYFSDCLRIIYTSINSSLMKQLGIQIQFSNNLTQKVTDESFLMYGISSNFVQSNSQNFVLIAFVLLLLLLMVCLYRFGPQKSWIHKHLKINNFLVIMGQYVPLMSSLFLPVSSVVQNMSSLNIYGKLNIFTNLAFTGISILIPFILVSYFQIEKRRKKFLKTDKNQVEMKKLIFQQYDWFFNSLVNISVSLMISFRQVAVFLIVNLITFGFGIYVSSKSTSNKLNNILLACHIFIYNFGFLGMFIFFDKSDYLYQMSSMLSLIFLFLGAVHEILTVLIEVLIKIVNWIKTLIKNKIQDVPFQASFKQQAVTVQKQTIRFAQGKQQNIQVYNSYNGQSLKKTAIFPKRTKLKQFKQTQGYLKLKKMLVLKTSNCIAKRQSFEQ